MNEERGGKPLKEGLIAALTNVYGDILRRQGWTTTPFVRWSNVTRRTHEFTWLGGGETRESMMFGGKPLRVARNSPMFESVQKMHATATLNPFEREILYGYPYVVGRRDGETIRGPLLTLPVSIEVQGDGFLVRPEDDVVHVNTLPFKAEGDSDVHYQKTHRIIDSTPNLPLDEPSLKSFIEGVVREFPYVNPNTANLDGKLEPPPAEPHGNADRGLSAPARLGWGRTAWRRPRAQDSARNPRRSLGQRTALTTHSHGCQQR